MSNISKEKKSQIVAVCLGTTAICAGIWFGLVEGLNERLKSIDKRRNEMAEKLKKAERLTKNRAALHEELVAKRILINEVEDVMASGDMYAWIIGVMNREVPAFNLTIPVYSREAVVDIGVLPKFPYRGALFSIRGSGRFHDFGRFIAHKENRYPFMRVQNIELSPSSDGRGKIEFRFDIIAPIKPLPASLATASNSY